MDEVKDWLDVLLRFFQQDAGVVLDIFEENTERLRELMMIFLDDGVRPEIRQKAFNIVLRVIHTYFRHRRQIHTMISNLFLFCLDVVTFKKPRVCDIIFAE